MRNLWVHPAKCPCAPGKFLIKNNNQNQEKTKPMQNQTNTIADDGKDAFHRVPDSSPSPIQQSFNPAIPAPATLAFKAELFESTEPTSANGTPTPADPASGGT